MFRDTPGFAKEVQQDEATAVGSCLVLVEWDTLNTFVPCKAKVVPTHPELVIKQFAVKKSCCIILWQVPGARLYGCCDEMVFTRYGLKLVLRIACCYS